jgi:hypothetical protein
VAGFKPAATVVNKIEEDHMKRNMGTTDRVIRFIIGVAALVVSFLWIDSLGWQIALWVVALIMLVTSYVGVCPLYIPFHISTAKK